MEVAAASVAGHGGAQGWPGSNPWRRTGQELPSRGQRGGLAAWSWLGKTAGWVRCRLFRRVGWATTNTSNLGELGEHDAELPSAASTLQRAARCSPSSLLRSLAAVGPRRPLPSSSRRHVHRPPALALLAVPWRTHPSRRLAAMLFSPGALPSCVPRPSHSRSAPQAPPRPRPDALVPRRRRVVSAHPAGGADPRDSDEAASSSMAVRSQKFRI